MRKLAIYRTRKISSNTCALACLEEFLRENGWDVGQQKIIDDFPILCRKGHKTEEGLFDISPDTLTAVGSKYGFTFEKLNERPDPPKHPQECILALTKAVNGGTNHCRRFLCMKDDHTMLVIDPDKSETPTELKTADFQSWDGGFIRLTVVANGAAFKLAALPEHNPRRT